MLLVASWAVFASGGLSGQGASVDRFVRAASAVGVADFSIAVLLIVVVSLAVNPFQTKLVKVLEGYWRPVGIRSLLIQRCIERQKGFRKRLDIAATSLAQPTWFQVLCEQLLDEANVAESRHRQRKHARARRSANYPPPSRRRPNIDADGNQLELTDRIMPTRLGNALRVAEDDAMTRFGIDSIAFIPLCFSVADDRQIDLLNDAQTALDVAVKFVYVWWILACLSFVVFFDDGPFLIAALGAFLLSMISYEAAVDAARVYGIAMNRMIHLYRLDVLAKLGFMPHPMNLRDEQSLHESINSLFFERPNHAATELKYWASSRSTSVESGAASD